MKERILIVDDEQEIRSLLSRRFRLNSNPIRPSGFMKTDEQTTLLSESSCLLL